MKFDNHRTRKNGVFPLRVYWDLHTLVKVAQNEASAISVGFQRYEPGSDTMPPRLIKKSWRNFTKRGSGVRAENSLSGYRSRYYYGRVDSHQAGSSPDHTH